MTFRIDPDVLVGMELQKERHGTPFSEQIRRALKAWLEAEGVMKAPSKRVAGRKRGSARESRQ